MSDDKSLVWAQKLVDDRAWVIHVESRTVGRVHELFDGEGKLYTPPGHDKPTKAPVLTFEQGHSFVARPGAFIELQAKEATFLQDAQGELAGCLAVIADRGGQLGVIAQTGAMLIAAVLRAQLRELERLHPGIAPPGAA